MVNFNRDKLLAETHNRCFYCGIKLVEGNTTFDHIIPKIKNGTGSFRNFCACCKGCNGIKWQHSLEKFRDIQQRAYDVEHYEFYFEKLGLVKRGEEYPTKRFTKSERKRYAQDF